MGEFNVNKSDGSLEQTAGMPSEYPATQVMLSDGVTSVEDAVNDTTPRTATGTTIAGLISAVSQLTETQICNCVIKVNDTIFLRCGYEDQFFSQMTGFSGSSVIIIEYNLRINTSLFYKFVVNVSTQERIVTPTTIDSWTLYYSGTPIS